MQEYKIEFLSLIADFINCRQSLNAHYDVKAICNVAKSHQLEAIVYYQTKMPELIAPYVQQLYLFSNRKIIEQELREDFKRAGIRNMILKGTEIAKYYPIPELRSMGDTDILVDCSQKDLALQLMEKAGFIRSGGIYEIHLNKNGMAIELHDKLMYNKETNATELVDFFSEMWSFEKNGELDISFHYIYTLVHLMKHFCNEGVGFRQFLDIAVLYKYANIDKRWVDVQLEKLGLLKFSEICLSLCQRWFDIDLGIQDMLDDNFFEEATNIIFENGVFGFDADNKKNRAIAIMNNTEKNRAIVLIDKVKNVVFPSYEVLRKKYDFLNRKPILLPLAWVYRWCENISAGKLKSGICQIYDSKVSKTELNMRMELFDKWGLRKR